LYASAPWTGFKEFTIASKDHESATISSLQLEPVDRSLLPLMPYLPGQFLTVRVWVKELGCYQVSPGCRRPMSIQCTSRSFLAQNRHYSLSDAPNKSSYRITVKREAGVTPNSPGLVSNILHSLPSGATVLVSAPGGRFALPDPIPDRVVLISAGVGVTPNLAMLNSLAGPSASAPEPVARVSWIQGCRSRADHVFAQHVRNVVSHSHGRVRSVVFYSDLNESERGQEGALAGRVALDRVDRDILALDDRTALYYICGPTSFMQDMARGLVARGVSRHRVIVEAFGAGDVEY
jgi:nitric oxide dioxygenase